MKKFVVLGAAALLVTAGVAVAQPAGPSAPPAGEPPNPDAGAMREGGPPGMMHGGPMHGGRHAMRMMERMHNQSKAARFNFVRDDASISIKCADDEPTRACVDAAGVLLDKLAAQPAR